MNFLANFKPKDFYKHDASAVNYPLNEPDDQYVGINRDESYLDASILDTCLYRICIDQTVRKPMQYNKGIARSISRLVAPDTLTGIKGYAGYGFDANNNFYADY